MAAPASISCPSCAKKFKGRPELAGKKIKCPGCGSPFIVPQQAEAPQPKPAAVAAANARAPDDEANPYGITTIDLSARCPNCANKMESEDAIICLHCGYNT